MDAQSGARLARALLLQPDGSPAQSAHKRVALYPRGYILSVMPASRRLEMDLGRTRRVC